MQIDLQNIDTPALIIDKDKIERNIERAIEIAGDASKLRPHVKTHKILEVVQLQISKGITSFKCATIAEAEMLGMAGARDVLIAYPVQGPKINRFIKLVLKYTDTDYSVLVDNEYSLEAINLASASEEVVSRVYIDINIGQDRTGIIPSKALMLTQKIIDCKNVRLAGLHVYDGHIHMSDLEERIERCRSAFNPVLSLKLELERTFKIHLNLVAGGSPTFPVHARFHNVECSPGTFVFWDENYGFHYKEQTFEKAAFLVTRVISQIDENTYCLDLGYKSVASENPIPRVKLITDYRIEQVSQSEEHLVIMSLKKNAFKVGQLLMGYPRHICPTVALYDEVYVMSGVIIVDKWKVLARKRKISI